MFCTVAAVSGKRQKVVGMPYEEDVSLRLLMVLSVRDHGLRWLGHQTLGCGIMWWKRYKAVGLIGSAFGQITFPLLTLESFICKLDTIHTTRDVDSILNISKHSHTPTHSHLPSLVQATFIPYPGMNSSWFLITSSSCALPRSIF